MTRIKIHVVGAPEPIELEVLEISVKLADVRGLTGLTDHEFATADGQPIAEQDVVEDGAEVIAAKGVTNG